MVVVVVVVKVVVVVVTVVVLVVVVVAAAAAETLASASWLKSRRLATGGAPTEVAREISYYKSGQPIKAWSRTSSCVSAGQ